MSSVEKYEEKGDVIGMESFETWNKMMSLPIFEAAVHQSEEIYGKIKGSSNAMAWAMTTTESLMKNVMTISSPIVHKFDVPINYVDQQVSKTIGKIEEKAPIIKENPSEIYMQAKSKVMDVVQPQIDRVCGFRKQGEQKAASLKELSYNKAKEVLARSSFIVSGIDSTSILAERLLDSFFPKTKEEEIEDNDESNKPISASEDPVLHTVQTIGRLNNKVARRVFRSISQQIRNIKKEDLTDYVASLIAVLRLTQFLNFLHVTSATHTEEPETSPTLPKAINVQ